MWHILQILHKQSFKTHNTVTNISREQPTKKGGRDNKFQMCSGQDGTGGDGGGGMWGVHVSFSTLRFWL